MLALALAAAVAAAYAVLRPGRHERPAAAPATTARTVRHRPPRPAAPARLAERATGRLAAPVEDAAAAGLPGGRAILLGGLTAADTSRTDVRVATVSGDRAAGTLPVALHDAAAVRIGSAVYLFGGGTGTAQLDRILRIDPARGTVRPAGRLPAPSSDQAAAAAGGTAYVVGGFTGSRWLDTIVSWRPGGAARVVGRLPFPLRYAAVAADGRLLVIAGGSREDGTASRAVLAFDTVSHRVRRIGTLPAGTTHAAAATLDGVVYVVGGRGAATDSLTARIVAVDPRTGRVRAAGSLAAPRSDLAAVAVGSRILLAGGRGAAGAVDALSELVPVRARAKRSVANVYAHDGANRLTGAARFAKPLVYVPNSLSNTVDVIDPRTYRVVETFRVGALPQHVVPAWNLRTLYVANDAGNSLTPIDPRTGKPGRSIPVEDPYNLYFTPDGRFAVVVEERMHRLAFRDPGTFALRRSLDVPCEGVDHADFTADGATMLASCEFSGQLVVVDLASQRVVKTIDLPDGRAGMPQDVRLAPDGRIFYVADLHANGVWEIDAHTFRVLKLLHTGAGAHGLYPSRDGRDLYVSNRNAGTVSVVSFRTRRVVATWRIPGGSPDMGGVSANGDVLWLSGRYDAEVYAISTRTGKLLARIPVGRGPHGLCVWPQPGRYSTGHTDNMR